MSSCKWCSNQGFFLSTDKVGLCRKCAFKIRNETFEKLRVSKDCEKLIEKTKNIDTVISSSQVITKYLSVLVIYEEKGINYTGHSIKELLIGSCGETDLKIFQLLTVDYKKNFDRIEVLKSINAKVNQADKFKNNSEKLIKYLQERPIKNIPLQEKINSLQKNLLRLAETGQI